MFSVPGDDRFFPHLYETLKLRKIGVRRSRLVPLEAFARVIRRRENDIEALEGFSRSMMSETTGHKEGEHSELSSSRSMAGLCLAAGARALLDPPSQA